MTTDRPAAADRRTALAPDLRTMPARAARAWAERMAVRPLGDGRYAVDSQSDATYVVDLTERSCSCADHQIRGELCKHLRRVAIEITSRRVPPPGKREAACAACGTPTFVAVDAELPLCGTCGLDSGTVVRDRETDDRLIVRRVTGRRADDVPIRAAQTTVADYPTNEDYPADDLVVEATYPSDVGREDPRTYSFPRSRLERTDDAAVLT
jgi:hypothetical protein